MTKFITIFNHTYLSKIKSKSFIISSILLVISIIIMSNYDKIQDSFDSKTDDIALSTNNNQIFESIKKSYTDQNKADKIEKTSVKTGKKLVKQEKVKYLIDVRINKNSLISNVYTKNNLDSEEKNFMQSTLSQIQLFQTLKQSNINPKSLENSTNKNSLNVKKLESEKKDSNIDEKTKNLNTIIVMLMISIIFYIILTYSNQIAFDIATEKTSRVSEMIITSVKPSIHIFGKILAVLSVAFTQILIVAIAFIISYYVFDLSDLFDDFDLKYGESSNRIIIYSLLYMVLGLISYISLASILGSITKRMENIGQSLMPITTISMMAFYIAIFSISNSDNLIVKIASFLPLFTPIVMPMRLLSTNTSNFQILIGLLVSVIVAFYLIDKSIKSYKYNILNNKRKR
ncbi:ABC transporter permease [Staphylococcus epidermidis]|uniref:ABC transporter permease n=1 Tax=Staphylococcus epidermidis TaxID=1282 RepID=UPI00136A20E8|nr:ABC transporter permease [Staphylococcus epidermidis]MCD8887128.1 ABC transporter permease [Staphylococcus epidermidis]MCG1130050.1 ABC transporter permease [Staphylococcus epidermidis]MCG1263366.1 ABC transporter permease [Staphylococcus epidermidis]MCG1303491.1 ABC transporter permease [Staphylococcus epidermidis]MCG1361475.1 ABC transporter permease [Staphylococcus epidermidis]